MPRLRSVPVAAIRLAAVLAGCAVPAIAQQKPSTVLATVTIGSPYKSIAVSPPTEIKDTELVALRDRVSTAAKARDRAALSRLVVAKDFFWERDGGGTVGKGKAGIDTLTDALGLSNKDAIGWDLLVTYVEDTATSTSPAHKGAICAPANPNFDGKAFHALLQDTQTSQSDWGYPLSSGIEVHASPQANAPVVAKLGFTFVRVMLESGPGHVGYLRVLTPDGKTGYVTVDSLAPFGVDQLCFVKEGGAWKIGGFIGAGEAQ